MQLFFHLAENPGKKPFAFLCTVDAQTPLSKISDPAQLAECVDRLSPLINTSAFVTKFAQNNRLFHAIGLDAGDAYTFLCEVELFKEHGIEVRLPDLWSKRKPPQVGLRIDLAQTQHRLNFHLPGDDQVLSEEEMLKVLAAKDHLLLLRGRWVEVDSTKLRDLQSKWHRITQMMNEQELGFLMAFRLASGFYKDELSVRQCASYRSFEREMIQGDCSLDVEKIKLQATLRPYQKEGVKWLWQRYQMGIGACLADDMGLGKSIQILAVISHMFTQFPQRKVLIIAPTSLLENWLNECRKFVPHLNARIYHSRFSLELSNLCISSYSMVLRHHQVFDAYGFDCMILDEAQVFKNPHSLIARSVKSINSRIRFVMTGTPIENSRLDLWSLFECIDPSILGSVEDFQNMEPERLSQYLKYFVLRRLKTDKNIIQDLPEKREKTYYVNLTTQQTLLYRTELDALNAVSAKSTQQSRITILSTLTKLKQICDHPSLYLKDLPQNYNPELSPKMQILFDLIERIMANDEKWIVFSHFKPMLHAIKLATSLKFGVEGEILTGDTPVDQRQYLVSAFQQEKRLRFLCLSLKAAGVGLNLTAASHVIHYDRWWNPAVEDQASDRSFRIGQTRNVNVSYIVNRGTVETGISRILDHKRSVAKDILDMNGISSLTNSDLMEAMGLQLPHATNSHSKGESLAEI